MESSSENAALEATTVPSWREALFADVLSGVRLRSSIYFRPEFGAPWGVSIADHGPVFHVIATGTCWLRSTRLLLIRLFQLVAFDGDILCPIAIDTQYVGLC